MKKKTQGIAVVIGSVGLVALTACGGSSSSTASTSAAADATRAPAGSASAVAASASPTNSAQNALQWCKAYAEITTALSTAQATTTGAQTSQNALSSFDQLFAAGANLGYITTPESDANRRAVVAYAKVMEEVAAGRKADSPEVKAAQKALTEQTDKDKDLLNSSAQKIQALCAPLSAPIASAPASTAPSGAAPSPAKS